MPEDVLGLLPGGMQLHFQDGQPVHLLTSAETWEELKPLRHSPERGWSPFGGLNPLTGLPVFIDRCPCTPEEFAMAEPFEHAPATSVAPGDEPAVAADSEDEIEEPSEEE